MDPPAVTSAFTEELLPSVRCVRLFSAVCDNNLHHRCDCKVLFQLIRVWKHWEVEPRDDWGGLCGAQGSQNDVQTDEYSNKPTKNVIIMHHGVDSSFYFLVGLFLFDLHFIDFCPSFWLILVRLYWGRRLYIYNWSVVCRLQMSLYKKNLLLVWT